MTLPISLWCGALAHDIDYTSLSIPEDAIEVFNESEDIRWTTLRPSLKVQRKRENNCLHSVGLLFMLILFFSFEDISKVAEISKMGRYSSKMKI